MKFSRTAYRKKFGFIYMQLITFVILYQMYIFMIRHDEEYRHAVSFLNWGDIHVDKEYGGWGGGQKYRQKTDKYKKRRKETD